MRWDRSYQSRDLEDRRGERLGAMGGGGLPIFGLIRILGLFGWKGLLVGLVIAMLFGGGTCLGLGGDLGLGSCSPVGAPTQRRGDERSVQSTPAEDQLVGFVGYVFDDVQRTWSEALPDYQRAKLVLFRRGVQSACGTASTAVGPFYCPLDQRVYLDLSFYDDLRTRFGAPGDFAQAYVIAHEIGHHVQNLRDLLGRQGTREPIAIELQADCLAGAWAQSAERRGLLEVGDIDEALGAAAAIGDDTLQRKTQGHVQPETWTHGSAAQRAAAFRRGYATRGARACDL